MKNSKDENLRLCHYKIGSVVDLLHMTELSTKEDAGKDFAVVVKRIEDWENYELRRRQSSRFNSSKPLVLRDKNGDMRSPKSYSWMVKQYIELHQFQITKGKIREGLMKEIKAHEEATYRNTVYANDE